MASRNNSLDELSNIRCSDTRAGAGRLSGPAGRALMELNVAAAGAAAAQIASGMIAGGERDLKPVIHSRLAIVGDTDHSGARDTVDIHVVGDIPGIGIALGRIAGALGGTHVHPGAVVDVIKMTDRRPSANSARDPEIPPVACW